MIRLFRKIRLNVFTEKKFIHYLLYAMGEIVLVVIGILIALAINNHNEERITREKEQVYLAGLQNEFQTSRLKLQELIRVNNQNYTGAKTILEYMSGEKPAPDEKQFSELLYHTFAFDIAFNPNNSLLSEMISSGSLKDISNDTLRIRLTNWISTLEDIAKQEEELAAQREKVLDLFRSGERSLRTVLDRTGISGNLLDLSTGKGTSNLGLLHSTEFENNLLMFILAGYATETSHYLPLRDAMDTILGLIEHEIRK